MKLSPHLQAQHNVPAGFLYGKRLHALHCFAPTPRPQVKLMSVERTDYLSRANKTLRQRALPVRTAVLYRKKTPVALAEHRDFLISDDVAATLPQGDCFDAAQVNNRCDSRFSHCFRRPPAHMPIPDR